MDHIVEAKPRSAPCDARDPLFAPLFAPVSAGSSFVLGRIAQSLDGYIATRNGESVWISGPDDLRHTHQLRALSDAVVAGARPIRDDHPRPTSFSPCPMAAWLEPGPFAPITHA